MQWTLRGLITSQLGNVEYPLVQLAAGGALTPKEVIFNQVQCSGSARAVLVMLAPPSGVVWCLYGARGSSQPHGIWRELCTVGKGSEACRCWLQLSYESGWMAYDVVVLLAFCVVSLARLDS